ncbi:MAG: oxidoreductase [Porticoccus sp.]|nr:oxidoreductase [Porticoccus sp.]
MKIIKPKLSVGIVGCGRIFKKHYYAISRNKNLVLKSICDINSQKLSNLNFVKNLDKINKYTNLTLFLKKEKLDICVICTPSGLHPKHVNLASNYVKNIILEKPMSTSLRLAYGMIKNTEKKKCNVFIVKQNRLNKPVIFLKDILAKKLLGKIKLITTRVRWSRNLEYFNQAKWRGKWKSDGGVLANQSSHYLDLLLWLINSKIKSVSALSTKIVDKIEAYDTVIGNVKFSNNTIANIEVTTGSLPKNLEGSISVFGQKGTVVINGNSVNILEHAYFKNKKIDKKNIYSEFPKDVYGFGHQRFYSEVSKIITNKLNNTFSLKSSIQCIELIHAMYRSSKLNKTINLSSKKNKSFDKMEA